MLKLLLTIIFSVICLAGYAQTKDSLSIAMPDSLYQKQLHELDSVQRNTKKEFGKLKNEYDSIEQQLGGSISKLQHKTDSLNTLNLPTDVYTKKLDSLKQLRETRLAVVKNKTEKLKEGSIKKINELKLSPAISKEAQKFTQGLNKLDVTLPNTDVNFPEMPSLVKMPKLALSGVSIPSMPNISTPDINTSLPQGAIGDIKTPDLGGDIKQVTDKVGVAGQVGNEIKDVKDKLKDPEAKEELLAKAEEKASEIAPVKDVTEKVGVPKDVPLADGQLSQEELQKEAKKQAVNHFAGKEAALMAAIDKMEKYKKKYDNASSIKDLTEKPINPLKGKPFIERLVPGITLQFQSNQYFMLDVNASAGYRFTERITAGLGWNQRWAYSIDSKEFNPGARIYGVRSYGEFNIKKGFSLRGDLECMNTFVDETLTGTSDAGHREWVWSAMTGVKQEYRISSFLKGNAQVMYNLFDPHHKSPYAGRLNVRMGFEFILKKKKKEAEQEK